MMRTVKKPMIFLLLIVISLVAVSCSAGNKMGGSSKKCGCGLNRGFVGY
ncbi:hypothetical protein EV199_3519 [Pseudobacter ginsenosidimutans]|uniref:Uncharacterized protein n=1 Tax=Pseudobacter ginsenosidimutans TaxID=661488 RepID=A0A4Q7MWR0_9BACT|nr:hypothetical protein EV199_3519 [Pseudobacter ginsenosidimutans]